MKYSKRHAFTLIELLMVIAIIGILAGILIPVVGIVKEKANIAASKSQLSGYVNAIGLFKGEYNYYPFSAAHANGGATIPSITEEAFIGALAATTVEGERISSGGENYGNRRLIPFYSFSESDFSEGDSGTGKIADRFDNTNIFIAIDGDGDGKLEGMPDPDGGEGKVIRTKVTAYVLDNTGDDQGVTPNYYLYN